MPTRVLVPSGVLGLGFDKEALAKGVAMQPDIICIDGGSTDSGPYYLGTGTSKYSLAAIKSEWRQLMQARAKAKVPLVIGSCGTCGTNSMVELMADITKELAAELGQTVKVAKLYSDQCKDVLKTALGDNRIQPLFPAPEVTAAHIVSFTNCVALAGAEQIEAAINTGADIVLAGRTTDTAVIAALPLMRAEHAGAAWHGAKIAECGALCSTKPTSGVILVTFDKEGFTVEALAEGAKCTPHSVSAHMLYENADPFILHEPGGFLDVRSAHYQAVDAGRVRVTGSSWTEQVPYTVKLEAARLAGYQTMTLALLRDPRYVAEAKTWVTKLRTFLVGEIEKRMGLPEDNYTLEFRLLGLDGVLGHLEAKEALPTEVAVLGLITARSQELAEEIAKLINPFVLHYPLTEKEELPTFAFPYSPAESNRGAVYEFCLNHVLALENPMATFRLETETLTYG